MSRPPHASNRWLAPENASGQDIQRAWAADNQQWWDWYMSLAVADPPDTGPLRSPPPTPALTPPTDAELEAELATPAPVSDAARDHFRREGYVRVPNLLQPAGLLALRADMVALLDAQVTGQREMGFPSLEMVWTHHRRCRAYVVSERLARVAAELLGVDAVRLYHDNVLSKNPGCGRTPWHYDAHHYPIDSPDVVTAWFPLQPVPLDMGPLVFAAGMDTYQAIASLPFDKHGDGYDRAIIDALREGEVPCHSDGYALGEVSFHHAFSLHSAAPNRCDVARLAIAITYFVDGARLVSSPTMISGDYEKFMPGIGPGQVIDSPLNPVLYRAVKGTP